MPTLFVQQLQTSFRGFVDRLELGPPVAVLCHSDADGLAAEWYGRGHDQASGGSLSYRAWNEFVCNLGFGREMRIAPTLAERQPNNDHE